MGGAQHIHDPELLLEQARQRGHADQSRILDHVANLRYGAPPHAGATIGLERLLLAMLGLDNIRNAALLLLPPTHQ